MATKYAKKIDDFDDLVNPRTLARHFLGRSLLPSSCMLSRLKKKVSLVLSFLRLFLLLFLFYIYLLFVMQR